MSGHLNLSLSLLFPFKTSSGMSEKPLMSNAAEFEISQSLLHAKTIVPKPEMGLAAQQSTHN
jgi:hypothetical protein